MGKEGGPEQGGKENEGIVLRDFCGTFNIYTIFNVNSPLSNAAGVANNTAFIR